MIHLVHLQVVLEDLKHLLDVRDVTGLQLRPDRDIIQSDLERSRGQEVSLHHVTEEERHQTGKDLVILTPSPSSGGVESQEGEGVLTADDEEDGQQFKVRDQVTKQPV